MSHRAYLVAKSDRSLSIPQVKVSVERKQDDGSHDTKAVVLSGITGGAVAQLVGRKVVGAAANRAGKYAWDKTGPTRVRLIRRVTKR